MSGTRIFDPMNLAKPADTQRQYWEHTPGRIGRLFAGDQLAWRVDTRGYSYTIDPDRDEYGTRYELQLAGVPIERRTPAGAWIWKPGEDWPQLVLWSWRNRWCAPTPEQALEDFVGRRLRWAYVQARKLRRIKEDLYMCGAAFRDGHKERLRHTLVGLEMVYGTRRTGKEDFDVQSL